MSKSAYLHLIFLQRIRYAEAIIDILHTRKSEQFDELFSFQLITQVYPHIPLQEHGKVYEQVGVAQDQC